MTHALVLAGAANREALVRWSQSRSKAAIRLYGRPMIEYVLDALLAAREVASVTVAGAPDLVTVKAAVRHRVKWVKSGRTMAQSLDQGLRAVQGDGGDGPVLVVACDLPLLTPQAVDEFIRSARTVVGDVVYPVVPRKAVAMLAQGAAKRFLRTRDGVFAAGNLALIRSELSESALSLLQTAHRWRKHPRVLGALLGWAAVVRLAAYRMSLSELEHRVREISRIDLRIVPVEHGCLGFDIDSPRDHLIALRCLARRSGAFQPSRFRTSIFERP